MARIRFLPLPLPQVLDARSVDDEPRLWPAGRVPLTLATALRGTGGSVGTVTLAAANGAAVYRDLHVQYPVSGTYTIEFSSAAMRYTMDVEVTYGEPEVLQFVVEPSNATKPVGQEALADQPVLGMLDIAGNLITEWKVRPGALARAQDAPPRCPRARAGRPPPGALARAQDGPGASEPQNTSNWLSTNSPRPEEVIRPVHRVSGGRRRRPSRLVRVPRGGPRRSSGLLPVSGGPQSGFAPTERMTCFICYRDNLGHRGLPCLSHSARGTRL